MTVICLTNIEISHFSAGARVAVNLQNSSHKPGVSPANPGGSLSEGELVVLHQVRPGLLTKSSLGCSLSQQYTRGRRDGLDELLARHASS